MNVLTASKQFTTKHAPEIILGTTIFLGGTAVGLACYGTTKAEKILNELEVDRKDVKEVVKATWKCYIPCALAFGGFVAVTVYGHHYTEAKNAAILGAFAISEKRYQKLKEGIVKEIGKEAFDKVEKEVNKKLSEDKMIEVSQKKNVNVNQPMSIIPTNAGDVVCLDSVSGRIFSSSQSKIEQAVMIVNKRLESESWVALNEFYYELGLDPIAIGWELGWDIQKKKLSVSYDSPDNIPVLILNYHVSNIGN